MPSSCSRKTTPSIKPLLAELKETTDRAEKTRGELFAGIKQELTVHEIIEEEIFYPDPAGHPKAKDIVLEGTRSTTWSTA